MATDKGLEDVPEGKFSLNPLNPLNPGDHPITPGREGAHLHSCIIHLATLSPPIQCPATNQSHNNAGQIESNYDETVDSFDDMNLKSELLRGEDFLANPTHSDLA